FTAEIAPAAGGTRTPTGSVVFYDGSRLLGKATLSAAIATLTTDLLSLGDHMITAAYAGDGNFLSSTSISLRQTVNPAGTRTTITTSQVSSAHGQSVTFTAAVLGVASGVQSPTGTVTFLDGTAKLGTAALNAGTAAIATSALAPGSHSITAVFNGDRAEFS